MKNFYIADLFKNIFHRKNFCTIIYLILNIFFIVNIFMLIFQNVWFALVFSIVAYALAVFISLSPLGERRIRRKEGCVKITDKELLNRLEPLFMEVKERAIRKHPDLHVDENIQLYIKEDADINAFAVGRRTICVTTGLLQLPDEEIKAVLGHEFGHLATHDTDLILLISGGNFIITLFANICKAIITVFKVIFGLVGAIAGGEEGFVAKIASAIIGFFMLLYVDLLMWIWTKLGVLLVMKTSRNAEYEADAFSCDLGYTDGLLSFFHELRAAEKSYGIKDSQNIFAALSSSHPSTKKRIQSIEKRIGISET